MHATVTDTSGTLPFQSSVKAGEAAVLLGGDERPAAVAFRLRGQTPCSLPRKPNRTHRRDVKKVLRVQTLEHTEQRGPPVAPPAAGPGWSRPPGGVRQGREGRKGQRSTAWTQPERACLETYQFENFLKFSLFFWAIKTPKLERHLLTNETAPSGPHRAGMQPQPERPAWEARTLPGRRHSAAGLSHDTADTHAIS